MRVLALRVPAAASQQQLDARIALAQRAGASAPAAGEDFCKLVEQYSDDLSSRPSCGSRGPQPFGTLLPPIQDAVRATKAGQRLRPDPRQRRSRRGHRPGHAARRRARPAYADVKDDMMQKALIDGLERARKQWLADLRRNVYIDVRL